MFYQPFCFVISKLFLILRLYICILIQRAGGNKQTKLFLVLQEKQEMTKRFGSKEGLDWIGIMVKV